MWDEPIVVHQVLPPGRGRSLVAATPVRLGARPCNGVDLCEGGLGVHHASDNGAPWSHTALALRTAAPEGPRVEVGFSSLLEPTTSGCLDEAAMSASLQRALSVHDHPLDHLSVGLIRTIVDPPPRPRRAVKRWERRLFRKLAPHAWYGQRYRLDVQDNCVMAVAEEPWHAGSRPISTVQFVWVAGFGTSSMPQEMSQFLGALDRALDRDGMDFGMVGLREPPLTIPVNMRVSVPESADEVVWQLALPEVSSQLPCGGVTAAVHLAVLGGQSLSVVSASAGCESTLGLRLKQADILQVYRSFAGLDPRVDSVPLVGQVDLQAGPTALPDALRKLEHLNQGHRPMPGWSMLVSALRLEEEPTDATLWRPWRVMVEVERLEVTGVDRRPFALVLAAASLAGGLVGWLVVSALYRWRTWWVLRRVRAQAQAAHIQRPLASVLADAKATADRGRGWRVAAGLLVAVGVAAAAGWWWLGGLWGG